MTAGIEASQWPEWREAEVAAALRKKYLETSVALRGKNNVGGIMKDDLVASFLEAFQRRNDECRMMKDEGRSDERGTMNDERREESGPSVEPGTQNHQQDQAAAGSSSFSIHNSSFSSDPADAEPIKAAAEAAYERVKVSDERSRQERKKLAEILDQVGLSVREKLDQIMALFTHVGEWFIAMCERTAKLKQKVCEMLEARHPRTPEKPREAKDWTRLVPSWVWIDPQIEKRYLEDMAILEGPEPVPTGRRKKKQSTDGADSTD